MYGDKECPISVALSSIIRTDGAFTINPRVIVFFQPLATTLEKSPCAAALVVLGVIKSAHKAVWVGWVDDPVEWEK